MKYTTLEELEDRLIGPVGTPDRDEYEAALEAEIQAYNVGESIKQARKEKKLTQEQLGKLMGVQRSAVSRIESGRNLTLATVIRAFKALGIPAKLSFGSSTLTLC